jgi:uncharacterized LabA/DUF88 family protein
VGKNVAVFVDVANIFYAAKAAGADIDYVLLLKAATAGRDLVRAYAYTGLDPENENQRNFHSFLARNGYKVVSKDIRKYGDGKVKANLDIELVVDMMKTARNLDVAVVVSGDGDFAPAIRAVQETGVRVEVISFRGNTSSDLMEVADRFTDITHLAKVEKGSTVSGRRVATDDEDLSMTEVPDKESEGTGRGRGRGRGRIRTERVEEAAEPVETSRGRGRGRGRIAAVPIAEEPVAVASATTGAALVALPGEKLSKATVARPAEAAAEVVAATSDDGEEVEIVGDDESPADAEERRRRRRRRGGRGRGRGRGQDQEQAVGPDGTTVPEASIVEDDEDEEVGELAPPAPRPAAFGSVWDSQIGVPSAPRQAAQGADEEYDDEPAIPEYLLAERRAGNRAAARPGQHGGQRGRGGSYAAAVDRERYGGAGRGAPSSGRVAEPSGGRGGSRPSEPSGRGVQGGPRGGQRPSHAPQQAPFRDRAPERRPSSEPWSEVPPELEELLRAQLAQKIARQELAPAARSEEAHPTRGRTRTRATVPAAAPAAVEIPATETKPARAPRTRKAAAPAAVAPAPAVEAPATAQAKAPARTPRTRKAATAAEAPAEAATAPPETKPARTPRTRKAAAAPAAVAPAPVAEAPAPAAAKAPARTPRTRKAAPAESA